MFDQGQEVGVQVCLCVYVYVSMYACMHTCRVFFLGMERAGSVDKFVYRCV